MAADFGGVAAKATRRVTAEMVAKADVIVVMERRHRSMLQQQFADELRGAELHILDVPDEYEFLEPALVDELRVLLPAVIPELEGQV